MPSTSLEGFELPTVWSSRDSSARTRLFNALTSLHIGGISQYKPSAQLGYKFHLVDSRLNDRDVAHTCSPIRPAAQSIRIDQQISFCVRKSRKSVDHRRTGSSCPGILGRQVSLSAALRNFRDRQACCHLRVASAGGLGGVPAYPTHSK